MSTTFAVQQDDRQVLDGLSAHFTETEQAGVATLATQLIEAAGGTAGLPGYRVLVAYGGGKDSTYVVAFIRAVQLHLQLETGTTFALRVANMRHAGVTQAVTDNIDRVYRALGLLADPRAELLTVDGPVIRPFRRRLALPPQVRDANRLDVLMNGHRAAGDGRPTFCNSCNFAVADFYGRIAWWQGGVDAVVTGDSRREQALYSAWIRRLARTSGIDVDATTFDFRGVVAAVRGISDLYYRELFGEGFEAERAARDVFVGDRSVHPRFLSIYDLVSYRVQDHWALIVDHLGFRFEDLAFSFTESDCANPTLMCHLRGLRAEAVQRRSYDDGLSEYLELAEHLMRRKEMPENLIAMALERYADADAMADRRRVAARYAQEAFGLTEEHLVCMVSSPFTDEGAGLEAYVERRHPDRVADLARLHAALRSEAGDETVAAWLESVSGLALRYLRALYRSPLVGSARSDTLMARVLVDDPHKKAVPTVDDHTGAPTVAMMSGR